MTDHRPGSRIWRAVAKVMLPFLLFVLVRPLLSLQWPPYEWSGSFVLWLAAATRDGALILPFALFAAGVVLARQLGRSRRLFRVAAIVGISIGAVSYVLAAWVGPVLTHRLLDGLGPEEVDSSGFRPRTPMGIARNLRFVEANPPEEYSLSITTPQLYPPNLLRWELHAPVAMSAFGLLNVLLGMLSAALTVDLTRGRRRNACLAIGLVGGVAFFACVVMAAPSLAFIGGRKMLPGIAAAWIPLVLPLAEALVLAHLVRRRRYG